MAKAKKLTVKIYENRQLKEHSAMVSGKSDYTFFPLYLMVTFNRKVKTIKSPTFEFLERTNSGYHLRSENWDLIQKNDERLFNHLRNFLESNGEEFSISSISPENETYQKFRTPLFDLFSRELISQINGYFSHLETETSINYNPVQMVLYSCPNPEHVLEMISVLNEELASDFASIYPHLTHDLRIFRRLRLIGMIPFIADLHAKEPFLDELKSFKNFKAMA